MIFSRYRHKKCRKLKNARGSRLMFPCSGAARWFRSARRRAGRRWASVVGRDARNAKRLRFRLAALEVLEDRTVLSVSVATGTDSVTFTTTTGTDTLDLKVVAGDLE